MFSKIHFVWDECLIRVLGLKPKTNWWGQSVIRPRLQIFPEQQKFGVQKKSFRNVRFNVAKNMKEISIDKFIIRQKIPSKFHCCDIVGIMLRKFQVFCSLSCLSKPEESKPFWLIKRTEHHLPIKIKGLEKKMGSTFF